MREIIVDNFAGGGGASTGIEMAIGRSIDIAINHDPAAIAMHKVNHPGTKHYCESVWNVDLVKACKGHPVALAWFSPDCKHFSKAKGGKPVDKNIRGLAWNVLKWAGKVRPRVIMLENVEEFVTWGPVRKDKPIKSKKGQTFQIWKAQLEALGYKIEHRELRACDYGAPTIRKRFFLVARCDGKSIVWPDPTHGDPESLEVRFGLLKPWRTAAEIIDWSLPCPSIFEREKPLADNTIERIAKGIDKFVINAPEPFIVQVNHSGAKHHYCSSINDPLSTVTSKHGFGVVSPSLIQYHSETTKKSVRGQSLEEPIMTLDASPRYAINAAFLSKYYDALAVANLCVQGIGQTVNAPIDTIPTKDRFGAVSVRIEKLDASTDLGHWNKVRVLLNKYCGYSLAEDELLLLFIKGIYYFISDIGLRMLKPRELFNAQGFPPDYIIDHDDEGKPYPQYAQVARCGNAVPPQFAEALTRANLPELCTGAKEGGQQRMEVI